MHHHWHLVNPFKEIKISIFCSLFRTSTQISCVSPLAAAVTETYSVLSILFFLALN